MPTLDDRLREGPAGLVDALRLLDVPASAVMEIRNKFDGDMVPTPDGRKDLESVICLESPWALSIFALTRRCA